MQRKQTSKNSETNKSQMDNINKNIKIWDKISFWLNIY